VSARDLVPRAPQRGFQSLFFVIPTGFLGLRFFLEGFHLRLDGRGPLRMVPLGLIQRRLGLVEGLLPAFTVLLIGGLFPRLLTLAALLLPFEGETSLPLRRLLDRPEGRLLRLTDFRLAGGFCRSFAVAQIGGQVGMLAKDPSDPTERLRTTPGFAMVAAMTSESSLSFAAPWWKRLLSAPHASRAAFIDGAAIARSKKPGEVW
jgi:hypothetical protein